MTAAPHRTFRNDEYQLDSSAGTGPERTYFKLPSDQLYSCRPEVKVPFFKREYTLKRDFSFWAARVQFD